MYPNIIARTQQRLSQVDNLELQFRARNPEWRVPVLEGCSLLAARLAASLLGTDRWIQDESTRIFITKLKQCYTILVE